MDNNNEMNQVNSTYNSEYSYNTQPVANQTSSDEKLGLGEAAVAVALIGAGAGLMAGISKVKSIWEEAKEAKAAKKKKKKKKKKDVEKKPEERLEDDSDEEDDEDE